MSKNSVCKKCSLSFSNESDHNQHIVSYHLRGLMINTNDGANIMFSRFETGKFKCPTCFETCLNMNQVLRHLFCEVKVETISSAAKLVDDKSFNNSKKSRNQYTNSNLAMIGQPLKPEIGNYVSNDSYINMQNMDNITCIDEFYKSLSNNAENILPQTTQIDNYSPYMNRNINIANENYHFLELDIDEKMNLAAEPSTSSPFSNEKSQLLSKQEPNIKNQIHERNLGNIITDSNDNLTTTNTCLDYTSSNLFIDEKSISNLRPKGKRKTL